MSLTSVTINGTDMLSTYGLIMLDDLVISAPIVKEALVDLPGIDGTLDYSEALTGYPMFEDRSVSFTLFKTMDESARATARNTLLTAYGGQRVQLVTPDVSGYYWSGRMTIGDLSGYNSGRIPVSVRVSPYRLKSAATVKAETLTANTPKSITLSSAGMPTIPTINCTKACTLTYNGSTYALTANTDFTSADFTIIGSSLTFTAETTSSASITITYQEGML